MFTLPAFGLFLGRRPNAPNPAHIARRFGASRLAWLIKILPGIACSPADVFRELLLGVGCQNQNGVINAGAGAGAGARFNIYVGTRAS